MTCAFKHFFSIFFSEMLRKKLSFRIPSKKKYSSSFFARKWNKLEMSIKVKLTKSHLPKSHIQTNTWFVYVKLNIFFLLADGSSSRRYAIWVRDVFSVVINIFHSFFISLFVYLLLFETFVHKKIIYFICWL